MRISDWSSDVCSSDLVFVAATDTFARGFSQTFSDIARDYGIYVVASNNQARYRASSDPVDIATFRDPDLPNVDEVRSEEHTSELQSLMRISYAVFCLKKKKKNTARVHENYTTSTQTHKR